MDESPNISNDDYTGDTTHRFFQARQQQDCSIANATKDNPAGCKSDLFPFVTATYSATNKSEGNSMGFYNAEQEHAPVLKSLADRFTLSETSTSRSWAAPVPTTSCSVPAKRVSGATATAMPLRRLPT
jgi:hypothetical protein